MIILTHKVQISGSSPKSECGMKQVKVVSYKKNAGAGEAHPWQNTDSL